MTTNYSDFFKNKIYLAGKITKHGWRDAIVNQCWVEESSTYTRDSGDGIDWASSHPDPIPLTWRLRVSEHYDITGPFFVGCDHSCTHGRSTHATVGGCVQSWLNTGNIRHGIRQACLDAIDRSDIVFAWLDDYTAHGTLGEIAHANAKGIYIVLAVPPCPTENVYGWDNPGHGVEIRCDCIIHGEQWFVAGMADHIIEAADASTAWNEWMGQRIEHQLRQISWYEEEDRIRALRSEQNEVELMFWDAWNDQDYGPEWNLTPQHPITADGKNYRPDFYLASKNCAIEIDGLEWHNGQEAFMRDRSRQRDIEMSGMRVLRFAAKEVMDDAYKCVMQAAKWVENV